MNIDEEEMNQYELYMEQQQEKENDLERDEQSIIETGEQYEENLSVNDRQISVDINIENMDNETPN